MTKTLRSIGGAAARSLVRTLVNFPATRPLLAAYCNALSPASRERFHGRYATLFRHSGFSFGSATWTVRFRNTPIRLPLRREQAWTDWVNALSILGHDVDVKTTYDFLLATQPPPDVFLDVGANFGINSVLLASLGIPTVAFEPNAKCRDYFTAACALNGLDVEWQAVAMGDRTGEVDLVFPDDATWLGSIDTQVIDSLKGDTGPVSRQRVPLQRLDDYVDRFAGKRLLIKIDVEGSETRVLHGATALLRQSQATVIFESNDRSMRAGLLSYLVAQGYDVFALPYAARPTDTPLDAARFSTSDAANFMALRAPRAQNF